MAQLAEQLICNQQVNGSSPLIGFAGALSGCILAAYVRGIPKPRRVFLELGDSVHRRILIRLYLDGFPSGQRGQPVNLLQVASVVRIHHHPLILVNVNEC